MNKVGMIKIKSILVCLLFLFLSLNMLYVDKFIETSTPPESNLSNFNQYLVGGSSNYTLESLTAITDENRAQFVTFHNRSDGLDIVYYDVYLNVWHVSENYDGVWSDTIFSPRQNNGVLEPYEYVSTSFGIFQVRQTSLVSSSNCSTNQMEYHFEIDVVYIITF